jgi:hypothetical protein
MSVGEARAEVDRGLEFGDRLIVLPYQKERAPQRPMGQRIPSAQPDPFRQEGEQLGTVSLSRCSDAAARV